MPAWWEEISQQLNFRLTRPILAKELMVSLIAVRRQKQFSIEYALMPIGMEPRL